MWQYFFRIIESMPNIKHVFTEDMRKRWVYKDITFIKLLILMNLQEKVNLNYLFQ